MTTLTPEELALFGIADPFPPPAPAKRLVEDIPSCFACGEALNTENASRLTSGNWKHMSCPAFEVPPTDRVSHAPAKEPETFAQLGAQVFNTVAAVIPPDAPKNDATLPPPEPKRRGRPPGSKNTPKSEANATHFAAEAAAAATPAPPSPAAGQISDSIAAEITHSIESAGRALARACADAGGATITLRIELAPDTIAAILALAGK